MQRKRKYPACESVGQAGCRESWCGRCRPRHPSLVSATRELTITLSPDGPCVECGVLFWAWHGEMDKDTQGSRPHQAGEQARRLGQTLGKAPRPIAGRPCRLGPAADAPGGFSCGPPDPAWVPAQPCLFLQTYGRPSTDALPISGWRSRSMTSLSGSNDLTTPAPQFSKSQATASLSHAPET